MIVASSIQHPFNPVDVAITDSVIKVEQAILVIALNHTLW